VGLLQRAQQLQAIFVSVDLSVSASVSFIFSLFFSFGLDVMFAPAVVAILYRLVAILM
jgi:hypothetical protein